MTTKLCESMIDTMAYGNLIAIIVAIIQKLLDNGLRTDSMFSNANYYAYICETLVIALVYAIYNFGKKPIYFISIISCFGGLFLSGCRTAWIAIPVGIIVLLICLKKFKHLSIFSGVIVFIAALVIILPNIFFPRATVFTHDKNLRFLIWNNALSYFNEHPIFGRGLMSYFVYSQGRPHDLHAHNLSLDLLVNFGVVGTVLFILITIIYLFFAIKKLSNRRIGAISISVIAATFAHGFTDVPFCGLTTISILILFLSFAGFEPRKKLYK